LDDTQKHTEGRPDADAEAVSISTMHTNIVLSLVALPPPPILLPGKD
jgi:hypothetical protein